MFLYQKIFFIVGLVPIVVCQGIQETCTSGICENQQGPKNEDDNVFERIGAIHHFNQSQWSRNFKLNQDLESQPTLLEQAVKNAYGGNLVNIPRILTLVTQISNESSKFTAYKVLRETLMANKQEHTTEMMILLYHVRQSMQETLDNKLIADYNFMIETFPISMQKIIFGKKVTLKNRFANEYAYITSEGESVVCWRKGVVVRQARFYFESIYENGKLYHYMRNDVYQYEAPMCHGGRYNSERYRIISCKHSVASRDQWWTVTPYDSTYYHIKHYRDKFMYAPEIYWDKNRRYVMLWYGSLNIYDSIKTHWIIN